MDAGMCIGLGTDVSGGYDPSMLSAMRVAVVSSRLLASGVNNYDHVGTDTGDAKQDSGESGKASEGTSPSAGIDGAAADDPISAAPKSPALNFKVSKRTLTVRTTPLTHRIPYHPSQEALFLATVGGARALGLSEQVGKFEVGFQFDALVVKPGDDSGSRVDLFPTDTIETVIQTFLHCGDDRDISRIFVGGNDASASMDLGEGTPGCRESGRDGPHLAQNLSHWVSPKSDAATGALDFGDGNGA